MNGVSPAAFARRLPFRAWNVTTNEQTGDNQLQTTPFFGGPVSHPPPPRSNEQTNRRHLPMQTSRPEWHPTPAKWAWLVVKFAWRRWRGSPKLPLFKRHPFERMTDGAPRWLVAAWRWSLTEFIISTTKRQCNWMSRDCEAYSCGRWMNSPGERPTLVSASEHNNTCWRTESEPRDSRTVNRGR